MTPEEKTKELFNKICKASEPMFHSSELVRSEWIKICKEQVLIAVNEIIGQWEYIDTYLADLKGELNPHLNYWYDVKSEIGKL